MKGEGGGREKRDGVSREVPCSALKGETVPDSLPATPKSPPTRRVPPRGSSIKENGNTSNVVELPRRLQMHTHGDAQQWPWM